MKLNLIHQSKLDIISKVLLIILLFNTVFVSLSLNLKYSKSKVKARLKNEFKSRLRSRLNSKTKLLKNKLKSEKSSNAAASNTSSNASLSTNTNTSTENKENKAANTNNVTSLSASYKESTQNNQSIVHSYNNNKINLNVNPEYVQSIDTFKQNRYDEKKYYNVNGATHFPSSSSQSGVKISRNNDIDGSKEDIAVSTNFNSVSKLASSVSIANVVNPEIPYVNKNPQYVEKIGYYDRDPPSQKSAEAFSLNNPSSDAYYQPFPTQ